MSATKVFLDRNTLLQLQKTKTTISLGNGEKVVVRDVPRDYEDRGFWVTPEEGGQPKRVFLADLI